jgi:hypothetical protein
VSESREQEDWFQRLPEHAKEDMRERWERSAFHNDEIKHRCARTRRRYVLEATAWFVIVFWMFHVWTWDGALLAAAAGSVVGLMAFFIRAGVFHYGPLGALGVSHMLNRYDFVE